MTASDLILARMEGESFDGILKLVRDAEPTSSLSEDHQDFLKSMLEEVKKATGEFEEAVKCEDTEKLKKIAQSFIEIHQMVADSCDS